MIEAIEFWNEPNNLSHWDHEADPQWRLFAAMVGGAASRSRQLVPEVRRVLGGICPIDPAFIRLMGERGVLEDLDAVGLHGFPLGWDRWPIEEWPSRIREIESVTRLPIWITEVGASSLDGDGAQCRSLRSTAELLCDRVERVFWYSLLDLPLEWPATISPHEVRSGSDYHRHFHMGLVRANGAAKPAVDWFDPRLGVCQWFHWFDPRVDRAVDWLHRLGVRRLRTCISWADWHRPRHQVWFDRLMSSLCDFEITLILCFTPPSRGIDGRTTSPPALLDEFTWFTEEVVRRYVLREGWSPSNAAAGSRAGYRGRVLPERIEAGGLSSGNRSG